MIDTMKAALDQNMISAFWVVVGSLVLSNFGLIASGIHSYYRKQVKLRKDIDSAWVEIRLLKKSINENNKE